MSVEIVVAPADFSLVVVMLKSNANELKIHTAATEIQGFSVYRSIKAKH
jgi:hypothetical protein